MNWYLYAGLQTSCVALVAFNFGYAVANNWDTWWFHLVLLIAIIGINVSLGVHGSLRGKQT